MLRKNLKNLMDHIWQTHMQTLMKRKRSIGISQIIDSTIYEWYSEKGMEVPNWKMKTDPDWWIEYLEELEKETS
tara:strand:+ start:434 stop:655 length:222 start_codon:yes stop_codon:yes gene_type:complete